jgi:hypothetical protein
MPTKPRSVNTYLHYCLIPGIGIWLIMNSSSISLHLFASIRIYPRSLSQVPRPLSIVDGYGNGETGDTLLRMRLSESK